MDSSSCPFDNGDFPNVFWHRTQFEGGVGWARLLPAPTNGESLFSWFDFVVVVVVVVVVVKVGEFLVFGFVPLLGCRFVSRCHTTVI